MQWKILLNPKIYISPAEGIAAPPADFLKSASLERIALTKEMCGTPFPVLFCSENALCKSIDMAQFKDAIKVKEVFPFVPQKTSVLMS